jgi:outer membrane lipoprotein-sorting protein
MRIHILPLILVIFLLSLTGCIQSKNPPFTGQKISEKTLQLQNNIKDYSVTIEEQLQKDVLTITRSILIKRPSMYRIVDSQNCTVLSNGTVQWSFCNGSNSAWYFTDPAVRQFINDVDYQQIFTRLLSSNNSTFEGTDTVDGTGAWVVSVAPAVNPAHLRYDFHTIRLWIDETTGMILRAEFIPESGTSIGVIRFSNITINSGAPDTLFRFTPGPGMNITDQKRGLYTDNLAEKMGYSHNLTTAGTGTCINCSLATKS